MHFLNFTSYAQTLVNNSISVKIKGLFMHQLYINIKNKRKSLGLSQKALGNRLGYAAKSAPTVISQLESGRFQLNTSRLIDIAKALETLPSLLLESDPGKEIDDTRYDISKININLVRNNIKRKRTALNMSQAELAEKTGFSTNTAIWQIETGKADISAKKIPVFARALNTTSGELLGEDLIVGNIQKVNSPSQTQIAEPDDGNSEPSLGSRLVFLRELRGEKQEDVANALGIPRSTLSSYENNKRQSMCDAIVAMAGYYNTTTDFLLTGRADTSVLADNLPKSKNAGELLLLFMQLDAEDQNTLLSEIHGMFLTSKYHTKKYSKQ